MKTDLSEPMNADPIIDELIRAAIDSVKPENFIPAMIRMEEGQLYVQDQSFDLNSFEHLYVVSIGKAAVGMAEALDAIIHPYVTEGIVLAKHLPKFYRIDDRYRVLRGGHPVPTADSVSGAQAILALLDRAQERDLVIFLISGGGSALMTAPVNGIDLETFQAFSKAVLGCGADIQEFNTLRKHLDGVKGGRLAQHAAPAQQITVILSDVVGSPLDIIASGPTVPDPSTYADALEILDRYTTRTAFPEIIRETLLMGLEGKLPETLKETDPAFSLSKVFLAAENSTAAYAAAKKGQEMGLDSRVLTTRLTGEASIIGNLLPSFCSELKNPSLLVFGGETTVTLKGSGLGGRNLELALAAVRPMTAYPGCVLVPLATDGEDGPTDAAGAIVTSETLDKALALDEVPEEYLRQNDAWHFFEKVGGLLKTGSSGTNVNDLTFLLRMN